jgi:hypothetical protein
MHHQKTPQKAYEPLSGIFGETLSLSMIDNDSSKSHKGPKIQFKGTPKLSKMKTQANKTLEEHLIQKPTPIKKLPKIPDIIQGFQIGKKPKATNSKQLNQISHQNRIRFKKPVTREPQI